ncbi:ATP-binding cassette domain-containing protein [Oxalobacteraceae bacterium]|nr:ATP-binding cassette domain-containing protein [Oxalobacteraceae bacterium]
MGRLLRFLISGSLPLFVAAMLAGSIGGVALSAGVALVNQALRSDGWERLGDPAVIALYLGGALLTGLLTFASGNTIARLMQDALARLRLSLSERVLGARLARVEAVGQSALVHLLSDDLARLAQGAVALPTIVVELSVSLAILVYIGVVNPVLCAIVVASQALTIGGVWLVYGKFRVLIQSAMRHRQDLMGNFHIMTSAIKELKQSRRLQTAFQQQRYVPNVEAVRAASDRVNRLGVAMDAVTKVGFLLTVGALVACAALYPQLTPVADVRSAVLAYMFIVTPLSAALNAMPQLFEANAALAKIARFELEAEPEAAGAVALPGEIGLRAASYKYADDAGRSGFCFGPLDLCLRRGEIAVFMGGNGAGKTTMAKLLTGLYVPLSGAQTANGAAVPVDGLARHRELVGAIWSDNTQDHYYFPSEAGALRTGLAAWRALGLEPVLPFVQGWVSCAGLSTGQKRRLALVSMLMEQRPFLIFDEWAANQDKQYRAVFYDSLLPMLREQGHGILVIAHDPESLAAADRVLELHDGVLSETCLGIPLPPPTIPRPLSAVPA